MSLTTSQPVTGPAVWRGDELSTRTDWIHHLTADELAELEAVGRRFVADDPDLRHVTADDYPLPVCRPAVDEWARVLDGGRGFVLVRGLRVDEYDDALSGAIYFVLGLHLGVPMQLNQMGDLLDHVRATSDKKRDDPTALGSAIRDSLNFHSDSSDVVGLLCLRPAKEGGASSLICAATIYNTVLERRPDLAPLMFETWHWDWWKQDHDAPANTYTSPMVCVVDGVFSMYAGNRIIRSAQDYPEVPRLTREQEELLDLFDEILGHDGLVLHMDFQPGDIQWLSNHAALHSRTAFVDHPEPERRRHLMRLWLKRGTRPLVPGFGKHVVKEQGVAEGPGHPDGHHRIGEVTRPRLDWGN